LSPGGPATIVFVEGLDCETSGILTGSGLGICLVSGSATDLVSGLESDRGRGTSKTECNEENKSVTTIQTFPRFVIDDGRGLEGEPIVSENTPFWTLRWKLPLHKNENCLFLIASSVGLVSVIAI
jgi:hypothetical protein